jgi:hypothetical protein
MKRGIAILLSFCAFATLAYFTASKWAIHHQTLTFYDILRGDRAVSVDIAVRRDRELQAMADMIELPVAILNPTPSNSPNTRFLPTRLPPAATWS